MDRELLIRKLEALESGMLQNGAYSAQVTLTARELAEVISALGLKSLDEKLRRAGFSG